MRKISTLLILMAVLVSCSKDEETATCDWATATLSGNTYKLTKFVQNGTDYTSSMLANACLNNSITLNADGTISQTNASNCSNPAYFTGTWQTTTTNGSNFLTNGTIIAPVISFNCNEFVLDYDFGAGLAHTTFTKQ